MDFSDIANWGTVGQIIVAITGCTTLTALLAPIAKFFGEQFTAWLSEKRQKRLESHKGNIEHKVYVSKVRFDTEFQLYKDLSVTFFELVLAINTMTPILSFGVPSEEVDNENYENSQISAIKAQDLLHQNAPFIPQEFFNKYQNLIDETKIELHRFRRYGNIHRKKTFSEDREIPAEAVFI